MAFLDEPPAKKSCTDYKLCLYCQTETKDTLVNTQYKTFKDASYETFLNGVTRKYGYGYPDFMAVYQRLHGITASELKEKKASWHRDCYNRTVRHLERDEKRSTKAVAAQDPTILTKRKRGRPSSSAQNVHPDEGVQCDRMTRSQKHVFDKTKCIFCYPSTDEEEYVIKKEKLYNCRTTNMGNAIQNIVTNSGNEVWKVRLADVLTSGDLLSRDIMYHNSCKTKYWEKHVQRPQRKSQSHTMTTSDTLENNTTFLAAEVQFFCIVQQQINDGIFLELSQIENFYEETLLAYAITDVHVSRETLKKTLLKNVENVVITPGYGNKSSHVHSMAASKDAINTASQTQSKGISENLKKMFQSASYLRSLIQEARVEPWTFTGSLQDCLSAGVPQELFIFIRWLLQSSKSVCSEDRRQELGRPVNIICQQILYNFKSDRQMAYTPKSSTSTLRSTYETPPAVGLSLHSHHMHRSKKDVTVLNAAGVGITYNRVNEITTQIAESAVETMRKNNNIYIPPKLYKGVPLRASVDNIDAQVDTTDGKNSFHGTAASVYQRISIHQTPETMCGPLQLKHSTLKDTFMDVSATVVDLHPCTISGNPKPSRSPHYPTYRLGQDADTVLRAHNSDILWLSSRYIERSSSNPAPSDTITHSSDHATQCIPVWSAYNSHVYKPTTAEFLDTASSLPIVNAPAHDWQTLITVLENLSKLNILTCPEDNSKTMVTFDMDLYKRALKLEYLDTHFAEKWWLLPGPFHTSLCGVRCLGKTVEYSGIDEAWIQADLYGSVVVNQIINGSHYDRAVEAHEITLQVLADLWLGEFFKEKPLVLEALTGCVNKLGNAFEVTDKDTRDVKVVEANRELMVQLEQLSLEKQLDDFDKNNEQFPMYAWTRMYMRQVLMLLAFHRSVKAPDLLLYLSSLEKLCTYFFAYNRLDYAQNIMEFTARAYDAKETDPALWQRLVDGEFAVTKSNIPFTSIGVDQAQEHENKNLKGEGGLQGITTKPTTLLKYCLAAPELARLSKETEEMFGLARSRTDHHHKMSPAVTLRQEKAIQDLKSVLEPHNPFCDKGNKLYNTMNKKILSEKAQSSILNMETRGEQAKLSFVEERLCGEVKFWDSMTKVKFLNWDDLCKTVKLKCNTKEYQLKSCTSLMSRLLVIAKSQRHIDLQEAIATYEFNGVNHLLMKPDGSLHPCKNKSDLIHALEQLSDTQGDQIATLTDNKRHLILDGMAVVQSLVHAANFKTCKELGQAFAQTIDALLSDYDGGRIIFDNYDKKLTIKDQIRYGFSACAGGDLHITDLTPIKDKKQFLASKTNKDSLTFFLADKAIQLCRKNVVTATRKDVLTNQAGCQPSTQKSSQEEADTLMMPHALEISATSAEVDFFTQDTDWWVLILRRLDELGQNTGIVTGTSENRRRIALQPIYDKLGSEKSKALPGFHAITGSDTTGQISGVGKKTSFKVFMKAPTHVIDALSQLGQDDMPSTDVIAGCQEFLCMTLSTKQVNAHDPATLRWKKFRRLAPSEGVDTLPPTEGTWLQHILRAHLQANIWAQDTVLHPRIPEPTELGWSKDDDRLLPTLTKVPLAPDAVTELLLCKCVASKCSSARCSCKRQNLPCTELCICEANEDCCNTNTLTSEDNFGVDDRGI